MVQLHGGRAGRIRTGDPLLPKQVRYQAAPLPAATTLVRRGVRIGANALVLHCER